MSVHQTEWLKENLLKVVVIVLLVVVVSGFYNPSEKSTNPEPVVANENKQVPLELAKQCRQDGEALFEEDKSTATKNMYQDGALKCYYMEPQFIFNTQLNTCLYSGGYSCDLTTKHSSGLLEGQPETRWSRRIVDVYTNKTINSVYIENSGNVSDWQRTMINEFWKQAYGFGF